MLCGAGMLRVQLERRSQACGWCGREESNFHGSPPQRPQRCASTSSATTARFAQHTERMSSWMNVSERVLSIKPSSLWQAWDGVRRCYGVCRSSLLAGPKRPR